MFALSEEWGERDTQQVEAGLRQVDKYDMCIAIMGGQIKNRVLDKLRATARPVFANAQGADTVCYLPNCTLPVVLRQKGDLYRYVGEVCAPANEMYDRTSALIGFVRERHTIMLLGLFDERVIIYQA